MKKNLKLTTFAGKTLETDVEVFVDGICFNTKREPQNLISNSVYTSVCKDLQTWVCDVFSGINPECAAFSILSRDLEYFHKMYICPSEEGLCDLLLHALIEEIATRLGESRGLDRGTYREALAGQSERFNKIFFAHTDETDCAELKRAKELFASRAYKEAKETFQSIKPSELSDAESMEYDALSFDIDLIDGNDSALDTYKDKYSENPRQACRFWFAHIRFLENQRNNKGAREELKAFQERYPLSSLTKNELLLCHYLDGRASYARGEYLEAISYLAEALKKNEIGDKKCRAMILNTSANIFTDNLFFVEAEYIAAEALTIRQEFEDPGIYDSLSCLGGIAFKKGDYEKALDLFLNAKSYADKNSMQLLPSDRNRLMNYLAKTYLFQGSFEKARETLDLASDGYRDDKGFSASIRLHLHLHMKQYNKMEDFFLNEMILPEWQKKCDMGALAWCYAALAQKAFAQQTWHDGIAFLARSVRLFLVDRYIIEAAIVSLYRFAYSVPESEMAVYRKLEKTFPLAMSLEDYVEKHVQKLPAYFISDFGGRAELSADTPRLDTLSRQMIDIDETNYDPEEVAGILRQINLL